VRQTSLKRYKYVGKERDEETGLYYYGARYYAAWICRFVSVDPLQFDYPYYTPFQYAGNKPITFIDLDGLEEFLPRSAVSTRDNPILYKEYTGVKETEEDRYKGLINHKGYKAFSKTKSGKNYIKMFKSGKMKDHDLYVNYGATAGGSTLVQFYSKEGLASLNKLKPSDIKNLKLRFTVTVSATEKENSAGFVSETIGHEVFMHSLRKVLKMSSILNSSMSDSKKAEKIIAINNSSDIDWYGSKTIHGQKDHAEFAVGLNEEYNTYLRELKEVLSDKDFSIVIEQAKMYADNYINGQKEYDRTIINYYLKYNLKLDVNSMLDTYVKELDNLKK
jgi:RHS repeat-associated protein